MPNQIYPVRSLRVSALSFSSESLAPFAEALLDPLARVVSLLMVAIVFDHGVDTSYLVLAVLVFALTYPGNSRLGLTPSQALREILLGWIVLFVLLVFFGWSTGELSNYSYAAIALWFVIAPMLVFSTHLILRFTMPLLLRMQGGPKRCVIVGMNEQGISLARRIKERPFPIHELVGFVDDRTVSRLDYLDEFRLLGATKDLGECVRNNRIHLIYISLPMAKQPRILDLLERLRDTTASIYFVPDIFVTDLIQGRISSVSGMPVVAVCETPFVGINGVMKRFTDILIATIAIVLLSPLLIAVAIGVKLSSPGPVIFKQRRYGLDGNEISVFKFRSLTVTEDGDKVYKQVTRGDSRITRFGALIRKTSMDELPQLFNVLFGGMSIVGPRPHAVAVNEQYRTQIPGYMVRHKVRPGITGWAQVNGFRGGDDLESMRMRVHYDLEYLRNYSVLLDLRIIIKTTLVVFRDAAAF